MRSFYLLSLVLIALKDFISVAFNPAIVIYSSRKLASLKQNSIKDKYYYSFCRVIRTNTNIALSTEGNIATHPKLDFNEDYYSVLEVSPTISASDLKKAYYKMVFKYHPDNKVGEDVKALCNKQMMVINAAYKVLRDSTLRSAYDERRKIGQYGAKSGVKERQASVSNPSNQTPKATSNQRQQSSSPRSTSPPPRSSPFTYYKEDVEPEDGGESLLDILGEMFEDLRTGGFGIAKDLESLLEGLDASTTSQNRPADSIKLEIKVLDSAINSTEEHLRSLQTAISVESALSAASMSKPADPDATRRLDQLQEQLRRKEALQGLKARAREAQAQISQMKSQRSRLQSQLVRQEFQMKSDGNNVSWNMRSKGESSSANRRDDLGEVKGRVARRPNDDLIEQELQRLKDLRNQKQQSAKM